MVKNMTKIKLTKKQKDKIEVVLAWRDFAMACNIEHKKQIQKDTVKMIEETLNYEKTI